MLKVVYVLGQDGVQIENAICNSINRQKLIVEQIHSYFAICYEAIKTIPKLIVGLTAQDLKNTTKRQLQNMKVGDVLIMRQQQNSELVTGQVTPGKEKVIVVRFQSV